jgi:hypothetical protein
MTITLSLISTFYKADTKSFQSAFNSRFLVTGFNTVSITVSLNYIPNITVTTAHIKSSVFTRRFLVMDFNTAYILNVCTHPTTELIPRLAAILN